MADRKDTLEARRWFRQRLAELAKQYPQLTQPAQQARLDYELSHHTEEETLWPANQPATPEDGPQGPADSPPPLG